MTLYSYIVTHDSGFAPNPFHGRLTLACCKPRIRLRAQVGDWVVGLSSWSQRIVYAMRVAEKLSFTEYWSAVPFVAKRPVKDSPSASDRRGDNMYEPTWPGVFRQLPSAHSFADGSENVESKAHDLSGGHVLIADQFVYFGGDGPPLPRDLAFLKVGRGHRCRFSEEQVRAFSAWFSAQSAGVQGPPTNWPAHDQSWREHR